MTEKFDHIALNVIDEDVSNHRLVVDSVADDALLASIKANGIQQPIKLAKKPDGRYTLVFGFRRTAMAKKAGLDLVPALVVDGLSATEIRSLQAIENLERKELHPMEEAQFCQDLHDTLEPQNHGGAYLPELIAQRVGRSVKWVENRLSLARLSPRVKQCFMDGDIQLQHAQLIGRLVSHEAQEEVLGQVKARTHDFLKGRDHIEGKDPAKTIRETRRLVEARLRDLAGVNWKLDAEFAGMPACNACAHNSANRLDLFDGDAPKKPQCLNAPCFQLKTKEAGLAVRRASNTLAKTEGKYTTATARKAMKERAVEFVVEKAVVEAAKHKMPSQKAGAPVATTAAEQRGAGSADRRYKVQSVLWSREREWREKVGERVDALLPLKDPLSLACMHLIRDSGLINTADNKGKAGDLARAKIDKAIDLLLGEPTEGEVTPPFIDDFRELLALVRPEFLAACEREKWFHPLFGEEDGEYALGVVVKKLGIVDTPPRPTYADVEAELFPPAAPKTGKKVRGKKKAAA